MKSHEERAAYCVAQSEQCRQLSKTAATRELATEYRRMAKEYLDLAEAERKLAKSGGPTTAGIAIPLAYLAYRALST